MGRPFPDDSFPREARGLGEHSTRTELESKTLCRRVCWSFVASDGLAEPLGPAGLWQELLLAGLGHTDRARASCSQASAACQTLNAVGPVAGAHRIAALVSGPPHLPGQLDNGRVRVVSPDDEPLAG